MHALHTLVVRTNNAHVIVAEARTFGKIQGRGYQNPLCLACFNLPSTSQRSNIIGYRSAYGL